MIIPLKSAMLALIMAFGLLAAPSFASADTMGAMRYAPASFAPLVEKVKPAVVSVQIRSTRIADKSWKRDFQFDIPQFPEGSPFEDFFKHFRRQPDSHKKYKKPRQRRRMSQGSGFIVSPDGYVVTNNHVVNGGSISVVMDNGKRYKAEKIGADNNTDLALLKLKGEGPFPYVKFASGEAKVGDWVVAVGNPFGLGGTVTVGVVSARGRDIGQGNYDDFIQIDAPINKGNSGGPTFNLSGEVVGVNTAIYSPSGGSVGIGFAIPAIQAQKIIAQLKDHGGVTRGWLGVRIQKVTPDIAESLDLGDPHGALVSDVTDGSPADDAGLKVGDAILKLNGARVEDPRDLARKVAGIQPGQSADLDVMRNGENIGISVKVGRLKGSKQASAKPDSKGGKTLSSLGLTLGQADDGKPGVPIVEVKTGGAAEDKGLRAGNRILEVNGMKVETPADVRDRVKNAKTAGKKAVLLLVRTNKTNRFVALGLGSS